MLSLVLVVVAFFVTLVFGLFGLDFDVTLSDGSVMTNSSSLEALQTTLQDAIDTVIESDLLGYLAYFFPISGMYVLTEVFFTCIIVYMVVVNLSQIITEWVSNRSS